MLIRGTPATLAVRASGLSAQFASGFVVSKSLMSLSATLSNETGAESTSVPANLTLVSVITTSGCSSTEMFVLSLRTLKPVATLSPRSLPSMPVSFTVYVPSLSIVTSSNEPGHAKYSSPTASPLPSSAFVSQT